MRHEVSWSHLSCGRWGWWWWCLMSWWQCLMTRHKVSKIRLHEIHSQGWVAKCWANGCRGLLGGKHQTKQGFFLKAKIRLMSSSIPSSSLERWSRNLNKSGQKRGDGSTTRSVGKFFSSWTFSSTIIRSQRLDCKRNIPPCTSRRRHNRWDFLKTDQLSYPLPPRWVFTSQGFGTAWRKGVCRGSSRRARRLRPRQRDRCRLPLRQQSPAQRSRQRGRLQLHRACRSLQQLQEDDWRLQTSFQGDGLQQGCWSILQPGLIKNSSVRLLDRENSFHRTWSDKERVAVPMEIVLHVVDKILQKYFEHLSNAN